MSTITESTGQKIAERATWNERFKNDNKNYVDECAQKVFEEIKSIFLKRTADDRCTKNTEKEPFIKCYNLSTKDISKVFFDCIQKETIFAHWFEQPEKESSSEEKNMHIYHYSRRSICGDAHKEIQPYLDTLGNEISKLVQDKLTNWCSDPENKIGQFHVVYKDKESSGGMSCSSSSGHQLIVKLWLDDQTNGEKEKEPKSKGFFGSSYWT